MAVDVYNMGYSEIRFDNGSILLLHNGSGTEHGEYLNSTMFTYGDKTDEYSISENVLTVTIDSVEVRFVRVSED